MSGPPPLAKPVSELPIHFALLLFPNFQALDVFGPLDALNTIKRLYPSLPLRLSILSNTTKPVSTYPTKENSIPFEQTITPTHTFNSPPSQPIDILFIPGGFGTLPQDKLQGWGPVVDYLNSFFANSTSVKNLKGIFTVCTGSILLARSRVVVGGGGDGSEKGILDGVSATTNKRMFIRAKEELPNVLWEGQARWVTTTLNLPLTTTGGTHKIKLWTTSGVSAGTDGIFAVISDEYGADIANFISQVLEYDRKTDPNDDPFAVKA